MTEIQIWNFIVANWPSIATGLLVASVWVRLTRFSEKHRVIERRVRRLMESCAEINPKKARKLFDDEEAEK